MTTCCLCLRSKEREGNQARGIILNVPSLFTYMHVPGSSNRHSHNSPFVLCLSALYRHSYIPLVIFTSVQSNTMAVAQKAPKGATVEDEKKKLLQQYKNDDGHFSLVR
jgi:hypothetical protein